MSDKLNIQDVSTDDLLAAISDRAPKPPEPIPMWLETEGYFPGTTRILASELYARFCTWYAEQQAFSANGAKVPTLYHWGTEMTRRFKKGRGKHGVYYWVTRECVAIAPPHWNLGGKKS